ncbi:MAG: hypothetical protein AB1546_11880, partial [bacterium]
MVDGRSEMILIVSRLSSTVFHHRLLATIYWLLFALTSILTLLLYGQIAVGTPQEECRSSGAIAYTSGNKLLIGNKFIERIIEINDGHAATVKMVNKISDSVLQPVKEEFVVAFMNGSLASASEFEYEKSFAESM